MGLFVSTYVNNPTDLQLFPNYRRVYRQLGWLIPIVTDRCSVISSVNLYEFI